MDVNNIKLKPNPRLKANLLSKVFYIWLFPFLTEGAKRDLNLRDVYSSLPEDSSERLGNFVEKEWEKELNKAEREGSGGRPPRLWRIVVKLIWRKYSFVWVALFVDELFIRVMLPLTLRNFISTFTRPSDDEVHPNLKQEQYLYAAVIVLLSGSHAIILQQIFATSIHVGLKVRLGISSLIYRKILKLQKGDTEHTNIGRLCNMLSGDVGRFDRFELYPFFFICPFQIAICCVLLWMEIGWACLGGVGCILCLLPGQVLCGRISLHFRSAIAKSTDERGRFLNEIIGGIRLIKMYAWEKPFGKVVSGLRRLEILNIKKMLYLRGAFLSLKVIGERLNPFCALILHVTLGNVLTAEKAFFTISMFGVLQTIMHRIPNGASQLGEMCVFTKRIEEFLASKESASAVKNVSCNKTGSHYQKDLTSNLAFPNKGLNKPSIIFDDYTATWTDSKETLKDLNVKLEGDKLVLVVGHVGCGKSSFLNAILSELPIVTSSGKCSVNGRLSYASQEAWIFPASLRQNILFGLEMDEESYWNTIKLCCLQDDIDHFPDGDLTPVGERGVILSGGQKARVNLARAVYQDADIYLLDDPLSAVDSKVGRLLFDKLIKEHLRGKMRILVTHQLQYLPKADYIIVLNREGGIWFQGTYEKLSKSMTDFTSLISDNFMTSNETNVDELLHKENLIIEETKNNSSVNSSDVTTPANPPQQDVQKSPEMKSGFAEAPTPIPGNIMKEEQKRVGSVEFRTYSGYFKSGGFYVMMTSVPTCFLTGHFFYSFLNYWLGLWTNSVVIKNEEEPESFDQDFYTYGYCLIMGGFILMAILRSILFFRYCMKISVNLHDSMFGSLVRAKVKFFDENPSGRILNRFTKDLNQLDEFLPLSLHECTDALLNLVGVLVINVAANYFVAGPAAVLLVGLWKLRQFYLATARDLKRIESLAKSPMFTHVTMTSQGLTTIRALRAEKRVLGQFEKIQDTHAGAFFTLVSTNQWFAVWLEMMSCLFLTVVSFGFVILTTSAQGGSVGMAISSILTLTGALQWGIRQSAETENYMTSVERVFEYCNLEPEAPLKMPNDKLLGNDWPRDGRIHFNSVSLSYEDNPSDNRILKQVSFSSKPREKIGIVGRTGSGKTSLITALFRMTEICEGYISVDSVQTQDIGLHLLRSRISIVPQDPILFSGPLRYNLDPCEEFSDDQLWRVLQEVDLHHAVHSLDYRVDAGGSNFSTGQRQLICLARAVLRNNRILVLDEPTANIDPVTDQLVQKTIRTKFPDCTILTIAHRLQSVLDSDRIIVLDGGRVLEFETPEALAANPNGMFSAMLKQSYSNNAKNSEPNLKN